MSGMCVCVCDAERGQADLCARPLAGIAGPRGASAGPSPVLRAGRTPAVPAHAPPRYCGPVRRGASAGPLSGIAGRAHPLVSWEANREEATFRLRGSVGHLEIARLDGGFGGTV
eukprot:scaffold32329_cov90-Isochrysis_galbana.AAC.1